MLCDRIKEVFNGVTQVRCYVVNSRSIGKKLKVSLSNLSCTTAVCDDKGKKTFECDGCILR